MWFIGHRPEIHRQWQKQLEKALQMQGKRRLKKRIQKEACFPHEIGLFLGYPLEDVEGFIKNKGRNCESCGIWKVYCNAGEKQLLFAKFKKCTEVYKQVFGEGRQLLQLTVAT